MDSSRGSGNGASEGESALVALDSLLLAVGALMDRHRGDGGASASIALRTLERTLRLLRAARGELELAVEASRLCVGSISRGAPRRGRGDPDAE